MIIAQSHSDDSATAPCMSRCMHFAQARPPMSCIPLVVILDECRTLWGEPERVQLSNVHGALACALCMCTRDVHDCQCMSSECDGEHSTT